MKGGIADNTQVNALGAPALGNVCDKQNACAEIHEQARRA
jgi:hypothetical protein